VELQVEILRERDVRRARASRERAQFPVDRPRLRGQPRARGALESRRQPRRYCVQRTDEQEELAHVVGGQRRHHRAPERAVPGHRDETFLVQTLERGANRRPADVELRAEIHLDKRRAGRELQRDDVLAKVLVGGMRERPDGTGLFHGRLR
jgi:hypothetical protein